MLDSTQTLRADTLPARGCDPQVLAALDRAGIVGQRLRERLVRDLKAKIVLRQGHDAVEVIGAPGTGKHKVVQAAHEVARAALGRSEALTTVRCDEPAVWVNGRIDQTLNQAIDRARGGTVVIERFGDLDAARHRVLVEEREVEMVHQLPDVLVALVQRLDADGRRGAAVERALAEVLVAHRQRPDGMGGEEEAIVLGAVDALVHAE